MSDREWIDAVRKGKRVSARNPRDLSSIRAEGVAIGYSAQPMVLVSPSSRRRTHDHLPLGC